MPRSKRDVVVVGAGPAGASAAFHLATQGLDVLLLDRAPYPRDKPCGDALMPGAVERLQGMGIDLAGLKPFVVQGVRMSIANRRSRMYQFPSSCLRALVVPRRDLDLALVDRATAAGAEFVASAKVVGIIESDGAVAGVCARLKDGREVQLAARAVVAADGASSVLARSAGLRTQGVSGSGLAVRAYFAGAVGIEDVLEVFFPLRQSEEDPELAGYGWVFPLTGGLVNLGVGIMPGCAGGEGRRIRHVFDRFVARLRSRDQRFASLTQVGRLHGAHLNCGFDAAAVSAPGLLLVGDAAGLVDPFTGEGIRWALESGAVAAETICNGRHTGLSDIRTTYGAVLEARYAERLRYARRMLDVPRFSWRLLEETFGSEAPLFNQYRRSMLDLGLTAAGPASGPCTFPTRTRFRMRVEEEMTASLGHDFPLLRRIGRSWNGTGRESRLAIVRAAAQFGSVSHALHVKSAATVELAYLGYLSLGSIERAQQDRGPHPAGDTDPSSCACSAGASGTRWANRFAVMAGDFFLAQAYAMAAGLGPAACRLLARCSGCICAAEATAASVPPTAIPDFEELAARAKRASAFHVLACDLGCQVANVAMTLRGTLSCYAERLGTAVHLAASAAGDGVPPGAAERLATRARTLANEALGLARTLPHCEARAELLSSADPLSLALPCR